MLYIFIVWVLWSLHQNEEVQQVMASQEMQH